MRPAELMDRIDAGLAALALFAKAGIGDCDLARELKGRLSRLAAEWKRRTR